MFTGLIREIGIIKSITNHSMQVECKYKPNIGDSIAINGACLTAVEIFDLGFLVDISEESMAKINPFTIGKKVHIEPAMRLSDRLDGHILQGHIDFVSKIIDIKKHQNSIDIMISFNKRQKVFFAPKGSIAIDGVSLTINEVFDDKLRLTIIPHTFRETLFQEYKKHDRLNIEIDFFAKYVFNILKYKNIISKDADKNSLEWEEIDRILASY